MKNVWMIGFACSLALTFTACGEPLESSEDPPTKEEVRDGDKADDNTDWCEVLDWYDDGICDDFCADPDPDCEEEIDCQAAFVVPGCDSGELLVDEQTCSVAGDDCRTDELCGVTSHCLQVGEVCPAVIGNPAACPSGTEDVETCTTDDCVIARGDGDQCTDVAFCEPIETEPPIDCLAIATCGPEEIEIDAQTCLALGDECVTQEICGTTAHCLFAGEECPQVIGTPAECPQGTVEVDTCTSSECEVARGTGDQCTDIAFCQVMEACLAIPTCDANQHNVSSDECLQRGDSCDSRTVCGSTLHCVDSPMICPQVVGTPPACPAGKSEVSDCSTQGLDSGDCELVFGTGDQCSSFIYCR